MVVCSPVASRTSISRSLGSGIISLANLIRLSVTPLMAETTTTTRSPPARYLATRSATLLMRAVFPTDVPPYFWTIKAMVKLSIKVLHPNHHRRAFDHLQGADSLERPGDRAIGSVMKHENQRNAGAFMAFGLDDRGDADAGIPENLCNPGKRTGNVDD